MEFENGSAEQKLDAVTHLMEKFNAEFVDPQSLENNEVESLHLRYHWDDGRSQVVFALVTDKYMTFWSPFAYVGDRIGADQILELSAEFPVGISALADTYCVVHKMPWMAVSDHMIDVSVVFVAEQADDLERELFDLERF